MLLIESIYPLLLRRVSSFSPIRPYPLQNHSIFTFPSRYLFSTRPDKGRQLLSKLFINIHARARPLISSTTVFVSTCGSVFDVCAISCFFGRLAPANYLSRLLPAEDGFHCRFLTSSTHSGTLYFKPQLFFICEQKRNTICFGYPRHSKELKSDEFYPPNHVRNIQYTKVSQW